jgi:hypothetical protein
MTRLCPLACFGVSAVLVALAAGPAASQNPNLDPNFGSARLKVGFTPDPHRVKVASGGVVQTELGGVKAWVSNAPDFRLHYTAGDLPLTFKVEADSDTTLLVNTPDGKWLANDDADGTLNPRITIEKPLSGRYEVWVGSVSRGAAIPGTLLITERR